MRPQRRGRSVGIGAEVRCRWGRGPAGPSRSSRCTVSDPDPGRALRAGAGARQEVTGTSRAIETATEYGVDEVIPWQASRSIVQWRGERERHALMGVKWDAVHRRGNEAVATNPPAGPIADVQPRRTLLSARIRRRQPRHTCSMRRPAMPLAGVDAAQHRATSCSSLSAPRGGISDAERTRGRRGRGRPSRSDSVRHRAAVLQCGTGGNRRPQCGHVAGAEQSSSRS
jgi:hypothetical protein